MRLMEIGGWASQCTVGCTAWCSPAQPSSAPTELGDWEQFLIKEGFPSSAQKGM